MQNLVIKRLSGQTQQSLADEAGVSRSTIQRRLKALDYDKQAELFDISKDHFKLANATSMVVEKDKSFVCTSLVVTGNDDDGILYADNVLSDCYFPDEVLDNSIGVLKPFIVGRVVTSEESSKETEPAASESDSFIWTGSSNSLTIINQTTGETYSIAKEHPNFDEALRASIDGDFKKAIFLIAPIESVKSKISDGLEIVNNQLVFNGKVIDSSISRRIVESSKEDDANLQKYVKFFHKCADNPSPKAINRLYDFLQHNDIEIADDGDFLAYKVITRDFLDCYTRKIDNSIGKVVTMKRSEVNSNDEVTCSHGLHVCAYSYVKHFSSADTIVVLCKVNPRDVVSIPVDYNNAKMRVCRYEVIKEVE